MRTAVLQCRDRSVTTTEDNNRLAQNSPLDRSLGRLLAAVGEGAIVVVTSDHGESIGENGPLHGAPKEMAPPEQRMVPLLIWASKPFLQDPLNAAHFASLQARKGAMASHDNLFDSVLGCLGVESGDGGINPHRNLCAKN